MYLNPLLELAILWGEWEIMFTITTSCLVIDKKFTAKNLPHEELVHEQGLQLGDLLPSLRLESLIVLD